MSHQPPPRYVMLDDSNNLPPPPYRSNNLPVYYKQRPKRRGGGSCCRCLCWCCCFFLLFIIATIGIVAYLLVIYDPRMPSYSVDNLSMKEFEINQKDLSLHAKTVASIRAENPNDMIGISYGSNSSVVVVYHDTVLCTGKFPNFYQGHKNTTIMKVELEGTHSLESKLLDALKEQERTGEIPLSIFVRVPIALKLGDIQMRQVKVNVACALIVDNLSPNKKVTIKKVDYKIDVEL